MTTTVAAVNKALAAKYGKGAIILTSGGSYYYFRGERGLSVSSLYVYRIADVSVEFVLDHVAAEIR